MKRIGGNPLFVFLFLVLVTILPSVSFALEIPFKPGEKLEYSLRWGFFPVGSATLEVLEMEKFKDTLCYSLSFKVRTNSFADKIYKVRTEVQSMVSKDFSRSMFYRKKQREGRTQRDVQVEFDYNSSRSTYVQNGGKPLSLQIPQKVFDPLAIAYLFRLGELKGGQEKNLPTCDGKRLRNIVVKTGKRERVKVPAGRFYAYGTVPEMKNLSGVFKKSPDGILRVWYSDDSRKIPIKISSKVVVGSFTASLVKASY